MDERAARIQALYRRATEQLISDSALRDALDDDQAQQLVAWGLARVRASAETAARLPRTEADAAVSETVQAVRTVMKRVNRLLEKGAQDGSDLYVAVLEFVEALHDLDLQPRGAESLERLQALAQHHANLSQRDIFSAVFHIIDKEEE